MKTFKSFDLFIQVFLLALLVGAYFINDHEKLNPIIIVLLFAVVQIISILANLGAGHQPWKMATLRKYHLIGTLLIMAAVVVAFVQDAFRGTGVKEDKYSMPGLNTLVYTTIPAILLALFYSVITWLEWKKMKKGVY